jgi:hypothetical protein
MQFKRIRGKVFYQRPHVFFFALMLYHVFPFVLSQESTEYGKKKHQEFP